MSSSDNRPQANIPSSTVVAIGGGFVSFALIILGSLTFIRMLRVARQAAGRRAAGEAVTFKELWRIEGGFWGFITGLGGESAVIGAGGRNEQQLRFAIWREIRMLETLIGEESKVPVEPIMWEVAVPEKGTGGHERVAVDAYQPLSVAPSRFPNLPDSAEGHVPTLDAIMDLSVLIILPTPNPHIDPSHIHDHSSDADADADVEDLPELVVGTTTILPTIRSTLPTSHSTVSVDQKVGTADDENGDTEKPSLEQLECAPSSTSMVKPAQWEKNEDGRWVIQGLG